MKRKLFRQTVNEWQSNVWLAIELLIVSVVMWYVIDNLYTTISTINEPLGFDTDHCYKIEYNELNSKSPDYVEGLSDEERNENLLKLVRRIESRPEIECVALGQNAYFYNGSNSGTYMSVDTFNTGNYYFVRRYVSPDFTRVFRIHGTNGESPEKLAQILRENPSSFIISDNAFIHYGIESMREFIGREFFNGGSSDTLTLRASYFPTRYDDYTSLEQSGSMIRSLPENYYLYLPEMVVRVKDNMDKNFIENLMKDADKNLRFGNHYISSVQSFDDVRDIHQRGFREGVRNSFIAIVFLSLNIFLGLLGTFWFRTQQRIPEIAIRKANGASRSDIFKRLCSEGQLMLLAVTPIAIIADYGLVYLELNTTYHGGYFEASRFVNCVLIAWALMALMIFLGTVIPANKAMKTAPAIALSDQ